MDFYLPFFCIPGSDEEYILPYHLKPLPNECIQQRQADKKAHALGTQFAARVATLGRQQLKEDTAKEATRIKWNDEQQMIDEAKQVMMEQEE